MVLFFIILRSDRFDSLVLSVTIASSCHFFHENYKNDACPLAVKYFCARINNDDSKINIVLMYESLANSETKICFVRTHKNP